MSQEMENFKNEKETINNEKSSKLDSNLTKWKKNCENFNNFNSKEENDKNKEEFKEISSDSDDNLVENLNSVAVKKNLVDESLRKIERESKENLEESQKRKWKLRKKRIFSIIDSFIANILIGPVCIGFWWSLWNLLNRQEERFPAWANFLIGVFLHISFSVLKHLFHSMFAENIKTKNIFYRILSRLFGRIYTYFFGFACVAHWRGCWFYYDYFFGQNLGFIIFFLGICLKELITLKSLFNLLAVPFFIVLDTPKYSFKFNTRYKTSLGPLFKGYIHWI
ncbi:uncharacterized protein LOC122505483 [Leptopilina heterotoma]|uniref:uncharacterized protein LOC122505483 n=1 Tax=Leptopilina heterotoma TaxID=63436 RepID=UPI001CA958D3|nr:uncharacterized protein LOC122505483 [Leptopilina heterotoma]